jgi:hypothetical protein
MPGALQRIYQAIKFQPWTIPIFLLLLCGISYGVMAPRIGIHFDDWGLLWYIHFLGPASFKEAFIMDRPLLGPLYMLTSSIFGDSLLNWQLFYVFTRWLSCLALWWTLKALWPQRDTQVTLVTLLFAVYPGYISNHIPVTRSHHMLILAVILISLGAMSWSVRHKRWFWLLYPASLALSAYAIFSMEYYFGLELLRPVFLWLVLKDSASDAWTRLKRTVLYWMPFMIPALLFVAWRISTPTPRGTISIFDSLGADLATSLIKLGATIAQDCFEVVVLAWKQAIDFAGILAYGPIVTLAYGCLILGTALLTILYLARLHTNPHAEENSENGSRRLWSLQAIMLGGYALLLGGIPPWMTNMPIALSFPWDRFTLAMMLGASLIFAGLIELLTRTRLQSILIVGVSVGIAAGLHFQTAQSYRKEWLMQKDFFWQLAWRAPAIEPGTVVLTSELPFQYSSDTSLTPTLNWTYAPQNASRGLDYLLYDVERGLPDNDDRGNIQATIRTITFTGSTSQAVFVVYRPPACLKVFDPRIDQHIPDKPSGFREALELSNPNLIIPEADTPAGPPTYFGAEPTKDWCYYFEKADLARQSGDWSQVVSLGDQALVSNKKFYRYNVSELLPFIEGYAHLGDWDTAVQLSRDAYQTWANMRLTLCETWGRLQDIAVQDEAGRAALEEIHQTLGCVTP